MSTSIDGPFYRGECDDPIHCFLLIIGQNEERGVIAVPAHRGASEWSLSGKLGMMVRFRNSFIWALAGTATLALFLMLVCHPAVKQYPGTGMSAPPASQVSIDFAPAVSVAPSHGDPQFVALNAQTTAVFNVAVRLADEARPCNVAPAVEYTPLYRRPPPSLS